jgi:hypothetical protein
MFLRRNISFTDKFIPIAMHSVLAHYLFKRNKSQSVRTHPADLSLWYSACRQW